MLESSSGAQAMDGHGRTSQIYNMLMLWPGGFASRTMSCHIHLRIAFTRSDGPDIESGISIVNDDIVQMRTRVTNKAIMRERTPNMYSLGDRNQFVVCWGECKQKWCRG